MFNWSIWLNLFKEQGVSDYWVNDHFLMHFIWVNKTKKWVSVFQEEQPTRNSSFNMNHPSNNCFDQIRSNVALWVTLLPLVVTWWSMHLHQRCFTKCKTNWWNTQSLTVLHQHSRFLPLMQVDNRCLFHLMQCGLWSLHLIPPLMDQLNQGLVHRWWSHLNQSLIHLTLRSNVKHLIFNNKFFIQMWCKSRCDVVKMIDSIVLMNMM